MVYTYRQLWQSLLSLYERDEAQSIIRLVLDERFGLSLTDIVSGEVEKLEESQKYELGSIMNRLQKGEPVQYVLGVAWFYGRKFSVASGVLIPRPETEELCKIIIDDYKNSMFSVQAPKFLDIGTGSGCIAITLALELPDSEISAIDISKDALQIADANAKKLNACVHFYQKDVLATSSVGIEDKDLVNDTFDCIISNPPYVTISEKSTMQANVLDYEPPFALFVPDEDPLLFYRAIAQKSKGRLTENGRLFFEINPLFANELKAMLIDTGFDNVEIINDSFGKKRFARATKH